jgi:hypothetical protein
MSAFGFFVFLLVSSLVAIALMLGLVFLTESSSNVQWLSQVICGLLFLFVAIRGLCLARLALLHRSDLYPRYHSWSGGAWMNPWQAMIAFGLCGVLGLFFVGNGIRRRSK